jgi:hypothetical protein
MCAAQGGGLVAGDVELMAVVRSRFVANKAPQGGAIAGFVAAMHIGNSEFIDNHGGQAVGE